MMVARLGGVGGISHARRHLGVFSTYHHLEVKTVRAADHDIRAFTVTHDGRINLLAVDGAGGRMNEVELESAGTRRLI